MFFEVSGLVSGDEIVQSPRKVGEMSVVVRGYCRRKSLVRIGEQMLKVYVER